MKGCNADPGYRVMCDGVCTSCKFYKEIKGFKCKLCNKPADLGYEIDLFPNCRKCYRLHHEKLYNLRKKSG